MAIVRAHAGGDGTLVAMTAVVVTVRENGPYKITGPVTIVDAEGREFVLPEGSGVVLCRCGHSANKPFCDATHKRVGFSAQDTAARVG
jgi:CDGSH iron-sulfur domain-containing protein 3